MASPFRPAVDLLVQYARHHRDQRNILTHFVGVPLIVFAIAMLLARPVVIVAGWPLTPGWVAFALVAAWYLTRGRLAIGATTTLGVGLLMALAHQVNGGSVARWLGWSLGFFCAGGLVQFIGHYYEGRKLEFADDKVGLLVGPMFVVLELMALAGFFKGLVAEIERRAGPTFVRDLAHPMAR